MFRSIGGIDSADEKILESQGRYYSDYTQFLKEDGLNGKRIGFYKRASGINYKVDTLMLQAMGYLKSQGVDVVEIE